VRYYWEHPWEKHIENFEEHDHEEAKLLEKLEELHWEHMRT
jgi:hypothetical protein